MMSTTRGNRLVRVLGLAALAAGLIVLVAGPLLAASQVARAQEREQDSLSTEPLAQQPPTSPTPRPAPAQAPAQVPAMPPASGVQTGPAMTPDLAPDLTPDLTQGIWLWQRTEMSDDSVISSPDPSQYTVTFSPDGRLTIQADCNRALGTYVQDGAQLTLRVGPTTLAACPPGSLGTEFLRDLGHVVTYVFDGEQLVLNLKVDAGNMIFSAQPPASLTGSEWRVQAYNNGTGGITSVLPDTDLTVTFGADGRVSGNTGCNLFSGPYTVSGSSLTFGGLVSTRRACLNEAANRQETAFLAALGSTKAHQLVGDRLTLVDAAGTRQVELVRPQIQQAP